MAFGEAPQFWEDSDDGAAAAADADSEGGRSRGKIAPYPMDFYAKDSGPWGNGFHNVRRGAAAAAGGGAGAAAVAGSAGQAVAVGGLAVRAV